MKKILLFALPMFMVVQLAAQQTEEAPNPRKKVTITRTWTDDQGQEKTITIIKEAEDTPENANWLESDDVAAPDDAATLERIEHDQQVDADAPWKDLPGELRWHMEDLGRDVQEVWPEIEYELRNGPGALFFENGRPLSKQAFLGVVTEPTDGGLRITRVVPGSAAEEIGFRQEDVIIEVDGARMDTPARLADKIGSYRPGDDVEILMRDDQGEHTVVVTLGDRRAEGRLDSGRLFPEGREFYFRTDCPPRTWLGVLINDHEDGARVLEVNADSPAESAGLQEGDIIYRIDDKVIGDSKDVINAVRRHKAGDEISIRFLRNGERERASVVLGKKAPEGCCPPDCCKDREDMSDMSKEQESNLPDYAEATLTLEDLRIYPNPTPDDARVVIRSASDAPFTISLLDASGRRLQELQIEGSASVDETLRLGDLPPGNYTLLIQQDGQFLTRTIIRND